MRAHHLIRTDEHGNRQTYFEVWHDESQFEAQRLTPYRVEQDADGTLHCTGCQADDCLHTRAVRGQVARGWLPRASR